mmetsp:Transcript_17205/g.56324  ORF Transcript_17205/g.56324 Transcript_17205/m.56324 type:complete len:207 (-) Transcript_17205:89-709(-)
MGRKDAGDRSFRRSVAPVPLWFVCRHAEAAGGAATARPASLPRRRRKAASQEPRLLRHGAQRDERWRSLAPHLPRPRHPRAPRPRRVHQDTSTAYAAGGRARGRPRARSLPEPPEGGGSVADSLVGAPQRFFAQRDANLSIVGASGDAEREVCERPRVHRPLRASVPSALFALRRVLRARVKGGAARLCGPNASAPRERRRRIARD